MVFQPSSHTGLLWSDTERKDQQVRPKRKYLQWQYLFNKKKKHKLFENKSWMVTHFKDGS